MHMGWCFPKLLEKALSIIFSISAGLTADSWEEVKQTVLDDRLMSSIFLKLLEKAPSVRSASVLYTTCIISSHVFSLWHGGTYIMPSCSLLFSGSDMYWLFLELHFNHTNLMQIHFPKGIIQQKMILCFSLALATTALTTISELMEMPH